VGIILTQKTTEIFTAKNNKDNDSFLKEWVCRVGTKNVDFSSHISAGNELAISHISSIDEFSGD
jgi:hypothetical protein